MVLRILLMKIVKLYVFGYTIIGDSTLLLYSLILVSITFWSKRKLKILIFYFCWNCKLNMQTK